MTNRLIIWANDPDYLHYLNDHDPSTPYSFTKDLNDPDYQDYLDQQIHYQGLTSKATKVSKIILIVRIFFESSVLKLPYYLNFQGSTFFLSMWKRPITILALNYQITYITNFFPFFLVKSTKKSAILPTFPKQREFFEEKIGKNYQITQITGGSIFGGNWKWPISSHI